MKATKITYWTATALVALFMTFSAVMYVTSPALKAAFLHLGYPGYFRVELAVAKLIGAFLLLMPLQCIKEWVYAGFTFTFVSAFISHLASGDAMQQAIMPLVFLVPLALSYVTYHKIQAARRPAFA